MDIETFLAGIASGKRGVELCHTEDEPEAAKEQGIVLSAEEDMEHWPEDRHPDGCMIVVRVDDVFRIDAHDDGLRELSVSQVDRFLEY